MNLDFAEVDVSFKYELKITINESSTVTDLVVAKQTENFSTSPYDVLPGEFAAFPFEVENTIIYTDPEKPTSAKYRVYVKWKDSNSNLWDPEDTNTVELMNNIDDTNSTTDESYSALLDVKLLFTQITNPDPSPTP